jgi:molybdopterin converting factor subunit 1
VKVEVLYFASLKERAGVASETLELPAGCRVSELWQELLARHPRLGEVTVRPLVACDLEYSSWEKSLDGVREVAFLPPVSGG